MYLAIGTILAGLFIYYVVIWYSHAGRLFAKIPGYKSYPIIGNMFDFVATPEQVFQTLRDLWNTNKGITKLYAFHYKYINVYDPKDAEAILSSSRYNEKELPYKFLKPWLNEGLLISNGPKWSHRRKILTPSFHFNVLQKFTRSFTDQTNILLKNIESTCESKETEIIPLISDSTLSIMCETSMGTSTCNMNTVIDKYFKSIQYFGDIFVYRLVRPWLYFDWLFKLTSVSREQNKVIRELQAFTKNIINDRRATMSDREINTDDEFGKKRRLAMLDMLLECQANGKIDDEGIREEVDTFLFEGHDTTAMALTFMIMRLANEPQVQENIYKEMVDLFGESDRDPEPDDLSKMKYLECCIKESLRLYPSVPIIARRLTEEIELSGYKVPVGSVCNIQVFDIHRDTKTFQDPEAFIPERFTPENIAKRHPYSYIPFSAGPRNCIGQKFALMEMKTVMSGVIRRYRLEPVTRPDQVVFKTDIVLRTNTPIYVKFVRR